MKLVRDAIKNCNITPTPWCGNIANTVMKSFQELKPFGIVGRELKSDPLWLDHVILANNEYFFDGIGEYTSIKDTIDNYNEYRKTKAHRKTELIDCYIVPVYLNEYDYEMPVFVTSFEDRGGIDATIFDDLYYEIEKIKIYY